MKIKILNKEKTGNITHKSNVVTFLIDDKKFQLEIIYLIIGEEKFNAFIMCDKYDTVKNYIENNYKCEWKEFQDYFLYVLYKYSRGVNLTKDRIVNDVDFIHKMENI